MELNGLENSSPFVAANFNILIRPICSVAIKSLCIFTLQHLKVIKKCLHAYICFHREDQPLWMSSCSEDRRQFIFVFCKWTEKRKNFFMQCDLVILWLFSLMCFAILLCREAHSPKVRNPAYKKTIVRHTVLKLQVHSHIIHLTKYQILYQI